MIHKRTRAVFAGLSAVATASTVVLGGGSAAAAPVGPAPTLGTGLGNATTVTLVTGDVVTLGGPYGADVRRVPGREGISFRTHTDVDGDLHVVPEDAVALLSSGRLDPRLFDVTELAEAGYADADRTDLPLIVDYPGATPRAAGARAVRELPSVGAVAVRADRSPSFWATARAAASRIWLDGPVRASLSHSVPQIGAPEAWDAGHTGEGVTVAVLDSGIDTTHPDLDDAVVQSHDFTGSASGADDHYGHGTHVASIITGSGERDRGVAPDATLLNGKVLDDDGGGYESSIIAGMEWAAHSGADVVNMSLGSFFASDGLDPLSQAVNRLTAETGALFVVSAGNSGPHAESVGSPGAADAALTVGAVDRQDRLAEFSSRGPRRGDHAIKPDITAPGVDIVAAKAANGWVGTPAGDGYVSMSGTSMAAPHVAGAAAILAGQHPDWTAEQLKSRLMSTARANPDLSVYEQGAGRVDVAAASFAPLSSSPGVLNLGTFQWPHHDDQPVEKTVTYTNSGTGPVTMDVAAEMTGPDGKAVPAGMFAVSPKRLTVPAGGSASAVLTTDTRVDAADGVYVGAVVATGGDTTLRTPVSVHREVESYDVTLTFLDREGKPAPMYSFRLLDHAKPLEYTAYDESGTVVVRMPKGRYLFLGAMETGSGTLAYFGEPLITVDAAAEYTFDARESVPMGFNTVDHPEAAPNTATLGFLVDTEGNKRRFRDIHPNFEGIRILPSRTTSGGLEFFMESQLARPDGTGEGYGFHASPYLYNLRYTNSRVPSDLVHDVTDRQLAKVVSAHAAATPGTVGLRESFLTMPLPFTLTEYYSPGTEWHPFFYDAAAIGDWPSGLMWAMPRSYERGRVHRERWNMGVLGPAFTYNTNTPSTITGRLGNQFQFSAGLYSDQSRDTFGDTWNFLEANTQLLRDGVVFAEEEYSTGYIVTELPPEEATYTVRATATRDSRLSSRVDGEWTFRSAHTDGELPTAIPALAVRFAPNLDGHNAAPAGRKFRFPVYVQRNAADHPGRVRTPVVEISYDDGRTWQPVRLTGHRGEWQAEVNHPANAQFASLRWSVSDADGNSGKATIIHAYALT